MCNDYSEFTKIFEIMPALDHAFFITYFKDFQKENGLYKTHIRTIMILRSHGPLPMSHISQKLSLEKGSFTSVANKLIKLGYIKKQISEEDKRVSLLTLTEAGLESANNLREGHQRYMDEQIKKLTSKEKLAFENSIVILLESLEKINKRT